LEIGGFLIYPVDIITGVCHPLGEPWGHSCGVNLGGKGE
jgi:hypothetical protein